MFAGPKPAPFALSALIHGIILGWLGTGPVFEKPKSLYQQVIAPHASKLVWYNFREKLPDVSPAKSRLDPQPPRAEFKIAAQEIVAGSPQAPHARQFIWQPVPKIELKQDLKSPNVLALHAPPPPAPPQPQPFRPPEAQKPAPSQAALDTPPELRLARNLKAAGAIGSLLGEHPAKPQPRAFVAPPVGQSGTTATPALPSPPSVQVTANLGAPAALGSAPAAPARRIFVPPSDHPPAPGSPAPLLAEAPALPASASTSGVNLVIVGLDPSANGHVPLPEGSRNAQFSAGPNLRPTGGAGGSAGGAALVVPGLMIRNGAHGTHSEQAVQPTLLARAAPTSATNLRAALHSNLPGSAPPAAQPLPAAARVTSAPDPILDGRAIYAMTVQMPNISSYSGSWLIWFAERQPPTGKNAGVSAPIPLRKVDPKYFPSAIADGIEGKVRLAAVIHTDGHVDSVKLLRHLDDRLDLSAAEAIHKWQFEPALRDGQPVDVDAVIEIPFHLAPKVPR